MKRTMVIGTLAAAMFGATASADPYQDAIDGLMRASYQHLALTYACRDIVGMSQYKDARVAAENAARATGMPTDVAMQTVEKMASHIRATPLKNPRPSLNDCTTGLSHTKREVLAWRAKFRNSQQ